MPNFPLPTFLALGDSYTIGEGVAPEERWPTQLAQMQHIAPPEYLARTGWTTVDLLKAIAIANFAENYDWVSVQIGVNDQYDGLGIPAYRKGLARILDFARSKVAAPHQVIVLSIPDYSVTPFAQSLEPVRIAQGIALFNTVALEIVRKKRATYCDITSLSQQVSGDPTLLVDDGLHPSGKMYQVWVEKLMREVSF